MWSTFYNIFTTVVTFVSMSTIITDTFKLCIVNDNRINNTYYDDGSYDVPYHLTRSSPLIAGKA